MKKVSLKEFLERLVGAAWTSARRSIQAHGVDESFAHYMSPTHWSVVSDLPIYHVSAKHCKRLTKDDYLECFTIVDGVPTISIHKVGECPYLSYPENYLVED